MAARCTRKSRPPRGVTLPHLEGLARKSPRRRPDPTPARAVADRESAQLLEATPGPPPPRRAPVAAAGRVGRKFPPRRAGRDGQSGAECARPPGTQQQPRRLLRAVSDVHLMVEQRNQPRSRHAGLPRPDAGREREQEKKLGGEPGAAGLDHGPTPPAGSMTSVVWANFLALRRAIATFATSRVARRCLFSPMFAGTARSRRGVGEGGAAALAAPAAPPRHRARPPRPPRPRPAPPATAPPPAAPPPPPRG